MYAAVKTLLTRWLVKQILKDSTLTNWWSSCQLTKSTTYILQHHGTLKKINVYSQCMQDQQKAVRQHQCLHQLRWLTLTEVTGGRWDEPTEQKTSPFETFCGPEDCYNSTHSSTRKLHHQSGNAAIKIWSGELCVLKLIPRLHAVLSSASLPLPVFSRTWRILVSEGGWEASTAQTISVLILERHGL